MFKAPPGQWTIDTLHEHFTTLLDEHRNEISKVIDDGLVNSEKAITAALASTNKAIDKADEATEKRFDAVNEFRAQLGDQARTFIPRLEAEQRLDQQGALIGVLAARVNKMEGSRTALYALAGIIGTFAGLAIAVIAVIAR